MNNLTDLPPHLYFHYLIPNNLTPEQREKEINAALASFTQAHGPPAEAFIYRISNRPIPTDHLCLGAASWNTYP